MLDAFNITNFQATDDELEQHILFWILAAGKNGSLATKQLDDLLSKWTKRCDQKAKPFDLIKTACKKPATLLSDLISCGIGCYNLKTYTILQLVHSNVNLRTCMPEDLEKIKGIGKKTSRCFIIHTREDARYAGLDTHILKFLRENGYPDAPKNTPSSSKNYDKWESIFLKFVPKNQCVAEFDLKIWSSKAKNVLRTLCKEYY